MAAFLDTNVAVYVHDHGAGEKRQIARQLVTKTHDLVASTQVLAEFYWVTTRRLDPPLSPGDALAATRHLASLPIVVTDASLVLAAVESSQQHQLSLWDALIIEAAARAGCDRVYSENLNPGQVIKGVEVVDPFR